MLRVLLLDLDDGEGPAVAAELHGERLEVELADDFTDLAGTLQKQYPDILIVLTPKPPSALFDALSEALQAWPIPCIVFTQQHRAANAHRAVQAGVTSYIVAGLDHGRVRAIVDIARERFAAWRRLADEYEALRSDYEQRRIIERAKGALMALNSLDEPQAHRRLRSMAMSERIRLVEAAERVLQELERKSANKI